MQARHTFFAGGLPDLARVHSDVPQQMRSKLTKHPLRGRMSPRCPKTSNGFHHASAEFGGRGAARVEYCAHQRSNECSHNDALFQGFKSSCLTDCKRGGSAAQHRGLEADTAPPNTALHLAKGSTGRHIPRQPLPEKPGSLDEPSDRRCGIGLCVAQHFTQALAVIA